MNKKFIERHINQIKEILILNDCVSKDWQPGEIVFNEKFGGFKNDYLTVSFNAKWVYPDQFGNKNFINVGNRKLFWSYDKTNLYWFDVKYLINHPSPYGIKDEKTINYWLSQGVVPEPFPA